MRKEIIAAVVLLLAIALLRSQVVYSDPALNTSNVTAEIGNITFLDIESGDQGSDVWQGFFGSVSGDISLENGDGDIFYDWSIVDASGEVYASRHIIADWSGINCSNQTHIYEEETRLDIPDSYSNGINDTFTETTHPDFYVGGRLMTGCRSTLTNNQTGQRSIFWNVMLNLNSTSTVYTAILDNDVVGFNGTAVDFQLLVPVNRTSQQSTYNIYVEID